MARNNCRGCKYQGSMHLAKQCCCCNNGEPFHNYEPAVPTPIADRALRALEEVRGKLIVQDCNTCEHKNTAECSDCEEYSKWEFITVETKLTVSNNCTPLVEEAEDAKN